MEDVNVLLLIACNHNAKGYNFIDKRQHKNITFLGLNLFPLSLCLKERLLLFASSFAESMITKNSVFFSNEY